MNPLTLHNVGLAGPNEGLDGVPESKIQGAPIVTLVPGAMLEKSPEPCRTKELFHAFTVVAVARDRVSNDTTPPKSMLPTAGRALAAIVSAIKISAVAVILFSSVPI